MTPTERQRIEDEAKSIYDKIMRFDDGNEMRAYIAGATAEHDKARNQAIQDCLIILSKQSGTDWVNRNFLKHELESLKTKP